MNTPSSGTPEPFIPLAIPEIQGNAWAYVKECLDGGWVSSVGAFVDRFEREFAAVIGRPYAVATVNGTSALHVALLVAGVEPDDEVIVSSLTFIAPVNAIRYAGAWPVLIDAEPEFWQIDPAAVERFLEQECTREGGVVRNCATGRRVRAILPVHILGHPVEIGKIAALARRFDLPLIEDASESLGATRDGKPVGAWGDIACFSFNGNKIITTGGGGMIVTAREDWAKRARHLTTQAKDDPVEYIHREIGYNYRLTNLQAALGVSQLELLSGYVAKRREIARRYAEGLAGIRGLRVMPEPPETQSSFWLYTVELTPDSALSSRDLMRGLAQAGIQSRPLWQPLHLSEAHRASRRSCPVAEKLWHSCLSLPSSISLSAADQDRVCQAIKRLMNP